MINKVLKIKAEQALNGTTVLNTIAGLHGAHIFRVHHAREALGVPRPDQLLRLMKLLFSKTAYQKGKQCLKALYLYKHHYKLRDPLPEERRQRFEIGHQIGKIAHGLFPQE